MKKIIIFLLAVMPLFSKGQSAFNFSKVWIQGEALVRSSTFTNAGVVNAIVDTTKYNYFAIGNSNICDSFGNLLYCSNGCSVYDKTIFTPLAGGGDTIVDKEYSKFEQGWSAYSQSSIMLPFANGKTIFVKPSPSDSNVINNWQAGHIALYDLMQYSVIDQKANGGLGAITRKQVTLTDTILYLKAQMMACKAGDGKSWWLLKQPYDSNIVYEFLFMQDTVLGPYVQRFIEPLSFILDWRSQYVFSRDGSKFASSSELSSKILVADFDRCTGELSNQKIYHVLPTKYGLDTTKNDIAGKVAFSPNGRFLYVCGYTSIVQMDLQASNPDSSWVKIADMDTTIDFFNGYCNLYLGNDDKLYIGHWHGLSDAMSVINNPNNKGLACHFCPNCMRFPVFMYNGAPFPGVSTPPCMPNYALGATTPPCVPHPVGVTPVVLKPNYEFKVFPNPTTGKVQFQYSKLQPNQKGSIEITDVLGKTIKTVSLLGTSATSATSASSVTAVTAETDLSAYPNGVYYYQFIVEGEQKESGKLVLLKE